MEKYFVGLYATSPCLFKWDKKREFDFYTSARESLSQLSGLELPFWGNEFHKFDEPFFLKLLDPNWNYVVTALPGIMDHLKEDNNFGIASKDEGSRKKAIDFVYRLNESIKRLNDYFGRKCVKGISLASAPSLKNDKSLSSVDSLKRSLEACVNFDWEGASLYIEHCDSGKVSHIPEKGFLNIEEEIEAISDFSNGSTSLGLVINWARSTIEGRSPSMAMRHLEVAQRNDLLKGVVFSGVSGDDKPFGNWRDLHLPLAREQGSQFYEESSQLSKDEVRNIVQSCSLEKLDFLGVKVLSWPIEESTLERRIGVNQEMLLAIEGVLESM